MLYIIPYNKMKSTSASFQRLIRAPTNTSPSKQTFTFSKGERFRKQLPECPTNTYHGEMLQSNKRGAGIGFGTRFDFARSLNTSPSATQYKIKSFWEENKDKSKGTGFGLGRKDVIFSSYIPKDPLTNPSPLSYERNLKPILRSAPKFTIRPKNMLRLTTQSFTPGPAAYPNPQLSQARSLASLTRFKNVSFSQPKTRRFLKTQTITPGPGKYDEPTMMSSKGSYILSQNKGGTKAKFDTQQRDLLFQHISKRLAINPGPGAYERPSQFGFYEGDSIIQQKKKNRKNLKLQTQLN